jgi:hypothetical protein
MFRIKNQYAEVTGDNGLLSDYSAMLCWFKINGIEISTDPDVGDTVNAGLVNLWIAFRESLTNIPQRFERKFLEAEALKVCEADDAYELRDCIDEVSDGHLMAIARLFDKPTENESLSIAVSWHRDDVKDIRPDLTDAQALEVLQFAKHKHDANIGINWEVLQIHADMLFPEVEAIQRLTDDEWSEQYPLVSNHIDVNSSCDGKMFETYGDELQHVMATPPEFVWTYQDDDNGNPCITSGFHVVNRIGYFISTIPCTIDTFVVLDSEVS